MNFRIVDMSSTIKIFVVPGNMNWPYESLFEFPGISNSIFELVRRTANKLPQELIFTYARIPLATPIPRARRTANKLPQELIFTYARIPLATPIPRARRTANKLPQELIKALGAFPTLAVISGQPHLKPHVKVRQF